MNEKCREILAGLKSIKAAGVLGDAEQIDALSEAIQEYERQDMLSDEVQAVLRITVFRGDVNNILISAFDGGIDYWCNNVRVEGEILGEYVGDQIAMGGMLILHDKKADMDIMLTKEKVLQGIRMYAEQPRYGDIFEMIDHKLRIDSECVDESVADAIIQYAVFSDIIYAK